MPLRRELMPPVFDGARVARLAELADRIDGAAVGQWDDDSAEFNREAGTDLAVLDFQGISGGQDHRTWVCKLLAEASVRLVPAITCAELVEMVRRVKAGEGAEEEIEFWLGMLAVNLPDPQVSNLLFWPGVYFGDGDDTGDLSPEQLVDTARTRAAGPNP